MIFEYSDWETEEEKKVSAIFQAIGAASTCWESLEHAGVFDSTRAKEIGDALIMELGL